MDTRFLNFCEQNNLNHDEAVNGFNYNGNLFDDKYELIGDGPISGVFPSRFGKFGNNVIQIAHAICFARRFSLKWVSIKDFGDNDFGYIFKPGEYDLGAGLTLYVDSPTPQDESAIKGWFFYSQGLGGGLLDIKPENFVESTRSLRQSLNVKFDSHANPEKLAIHIRGGSDIFGMEKGKPLSLELNPGYVQPPLSFYTKILDAWVPTRENPEVVLVTMDFSNPCLIGIQDELSRRRIPFYVQTGSLIEDIQVLIDSTSIVAGYGTFVPVLNLFSDSIRDIYCFRGDGFQSYYKYLGKTLHIIKDKHDTYTRPGTWANTDEQISMMLSYPDAYLEIEA